MKKHTNSDSAVAWQYSWDASGVEYIAIGRERGVGRPTHITETKVLREGLLIDLDKEGKVLGIEILSGPPKNAPGTKVTPPKTPSDV